MNPVKNLKSLLRASISFSFIVVLLFFQYLAPLYSHAVSCSGNQPICSAGSSFVCPGGQAPCCLQFSGEAGCSNGLSCFGGRGSCVSSTSTSSTTTSSTTGGAVMCGGGSTPNCSFGQNYICPSGQSPCCLQFSDEAGCSNGLSCFGGRGFCGTTSTTSTSTSSTSTTGGFCGPGASKPTCTGGLNYICPGGQFPCCVANSQEPGCGNGLSCFGGRGFCGTTSTTSTSTSSTSTTGGFCGPGASKPTCTGGLNYICPGGQFPCCVANSQEPGCGNGLSCFGGRGFCGTTSTTSTSTSSTSTTGGFCGPGASKPTCTGGLNYICPGGQFPCCVANSQEPGCGNGLSCFGGRGFCGTTSTTSTSTSSTSTTGGFCGPGASKPTCTGGLNYICPGGQFPCCVANSQEPGCGNGLSCFGGRGFCGTTSTTSTSTSSTSTTGGFCGPGASKPTCTGGLNYICPGGQFPCCVANSQEPGCGNGLSCFGGRGFCGTTSTTSTSTSSTSTTGGFCGPGASKPTCTGGLNYICPGGQFPCCVANSQEPGCGNGLSCFGGRGFCGTTSTTSTSTSSTSTTGGFCGPGASKPTCTGGLNYICPGGQFPCCVANSQEPGCGNGLSCFGGRGFCGTTSTTSTSTSSTSTTGGVVMCGGGSTPNCPFGQNYICPIGQAPCCIQFSDEAGCSNGLSCFGGIGACIGTSSGSSSSSGSTIPYCSSGQITCDIGVPACNSGNAPTCGSNFGLPPVFAGQGCLTPNMNLFIVGDAFCAATQRVTLEKNATCDSKRNLCPSNRKRYSHCREDKNSCQCVCQFKSKRQKRTPRCTKQDQVVCSKNFTPRCSKPNNQPICSDGKLLCVDQKLRTVDLQDIILCKRKKKNRK